MCKQKNTPRTGGGDIITLGRAETNTEALACSPQKTEAEVQLLHQQKVFYLLCFSLKICLVTGILSLKRFLSYSSQKSNFIRKRK